MQTKKVVICVPPADEKAPKKTGFLAKKEVSALENILKNDPDIDFLGNIDFNQVRVENDRFMVSGINLAGLDLFFWFAPNMKKHVATLSALSNYTKILKSPASFITTADKFLSHSLLKSKGLPVADFALVSCDDTSQMKKIMDEWKTVVLKPRLGNFGRGIIKIDTFETLRDVAGVLKVEHKQKEVFIEKFYENNQSEWISTTLIGGKAIYGYRKRPEKFADWKVFDPKAIGGDAFWADPEPVRSLAEKAASILDISIVGFDFIKTNEGYKIVDENNFPGFYTECFKKSGFPESEWLAGLIKSSI